MEENILNVIDELSEKVKEILSAEIPEAKVERFDTVKTNGVEYNGITIQSGTGKLAPVYWLNGEVRKILDGKTTIVESVREIVDGYKTLIKNPPNFPELNFENAREMLFACIVNTEYNSKLLRDMPHREIEDLSVVARFGNAGNSFMVTDEACKSFDMTPDEVIKTAIENSRKKAYRLIPMNEIIKGLKEEEAADGIIVITSSELSLGAVVPFISDDARREVHERFGGDYYIIPSSIHECIAVSAKTCGPDKLRMMVEEINANELALQEKLSDNVYFVGENHEISVS